MREIYQLNITGPDQPGVTASLSQILAEHHVQILDLNQSVIHQTLALGMLIEIPREGGSGPVLKDLLYRGHELELQVRMTPVSLESYEAWVRRQGAPRHILTLLARDIAADHVAAVTSVVAEHGLNIDHITRLSGRRSFRHGNRHRVACVEFSVRGAPEDEDAIRGQFLDIASDLGVDIAWQEDNLYRRNRRLVAFDMDSTLIQAEVIVELAKEAGRGDAVHRITEAAMRGEIDFAESFRQRVAQLAGLDESVLAQVAERLPLTEGAERLLTVLTKVGFKTAIISGGFGYFGRVLQQRLGFDYVCANELDIRDGRVTGEVIEPIVDGPRKAQLLDEIVAKEGLSREQVIAVGDGANDLPMLNRAGLGIAFHAKPRVREEAGHHISHLGLDSILYMLGMRDRDAPA